MSNVKKVAIKILENKQACITIMWLLLELINYTNAFCQKENIAGEYIYKTHHLDKTGFENHLKISVKKAFILRGYKVQLSGKDFLTKNY